ncbi:hypothetical protein [Bradyrhizobium shewense]|uniref:hypothetical protein n=1 Tax=Bradyrhizobium shewense TaxID=1761772 RepID=UPI00101AE90E|nr:hypothetical protein [Bradyrhizobium shewense]
MGVQLEEHVAHATLPMWLPLLVIVGVLKMSPFQQRIATLTTVTTHLITELYELEGLHELVKKAELSARRLNRSARASLARSSTPRRCSVAPRLASTRHRRPA